LMDEDFEFEGDSDDAELVRAGSATELQSPAAPRESKYFALVQGWSREHPEAKVRFINEDLDEGCVVLKVCGRELQIYPPQEADSGFFVSTEEEDGPLNLLVTELNDTPHLRTLPQLLAHASQLLSNKVRRTTEALVRSSVCAEHGESHAQLTRRKSWTTLDFDGLRHMQNELIERVCIAAQVERHVAALLLLHAQWNEQVVLRRIGTDGDALRVAAGVQLDGGKAERCQGKPQLCSVCFADEAVECLPCGHGLCEDDWPRFLKCNLESGTVGGANCLQLRCPGERCPLIVSSSLFERFLEPCDYERYLNLRVLSFVNDNPNIVWCPASGCDFCVGFSQRKSTVQCRCGHRFCFSCKRGAHAPAKCSSAKSWLERLEKMSGLEGCQAAFGAKPCPNPDCTVLSNKESGCHYLLCPHCKEKWCWQCGDWGGGPSGRPEPHHVFDCNNPVNQTWARQTLSLDLFDDARRYWFYHERYSNHLQSLIFAEELRTSLSVPDYEVCNPPEASRSYSSTLNYDAIGTGCAQSMLDSKQSWTASMQQVEEWMQIDLGADRPIVGVVLQGRGDSTPQEWVTRFKVEYGSNSIRPDGVVGEFDGCSEGDSRVNVFFPSCVSARYFRLSPLEWHCRISMRAGVLVDNLEVAEACDGDSVMKEQDAQQLIRDAADLLIECRLVLAWTYVWAFFEKDDAQRRLFEFVQKDLETKTEQLSSMIETHKTADVIKERGKLLDYVTALRGYLENIKQYTMIDPDTDVA